MRFVGCRLRDITGIIALSLMLSANLLAQNEHVATCQPASGLATLTNASLMDKVVASLGDHNTISSLKAIRYTAEVSTGTGASSANVKVTETHIYPDHVLVTTQIPGGSETRLEASPAGSYVQMSGGTKTDLPATVSDELVKMARLDRFYIGQVIRDGKITITETGTKRIGDVEAAALLVNVRGAEVTWYVDRVDGKLLRSAKKVPGVSGMADQVVDYSDWRNCDGLEVSFLRSITQDGKTSQDKVLSVELNPSLSDPQQAALATAASDRRTSSSAQVQALPKPFGFEMGMTRAQIIDKLGRESIKEEKNGMLVLSTAPSPHSAFESYVVAISPDKGLLKVVANGLTLSVNDEGDQLKEKFENIYDGLAAKYGKGNRLDFVRGNDVNKEAQFWMMTLLHGERNLTAYWNYDDKSAGNTRTGIVLEAKALNINKAYITLTYEFPGWNAYVESRKAKQDSVF